MEQQLSPQKVAAFKEQAEAARNNLKAFLKNEEGWKHLKDANIDGKICKVYSRQVQNRIASKGIVEDVEGTPQEISQMLMDDKIISALYPSLKEFRIIKKITDNISIGYSRHQGGVIASDRDFVIIIDSLLAQDGSYYLDSQFSTNYPLPEVEGVVRATVYLSGFLVERINQTSCRVYYGSDSDLKGAIPDFIKNMVTKEEGELAGKIDGCLKEWRKQKKQ